MKEKKSKNVFSRLGAWLKEKVRKFFVALKKNPQSIPFLALVIAFVQYTLNLTHIANTTSVLLRDNIGLASFVIILFLMLSFVCMLNAYPKRQKPKYAMMAVMAVLYGIVIFCEIHYLGVATNADLTIVRPDYVPSVVQSIKTMRINIVLVAVTLVLMATEPFYAKFIKKINTSIEIESGSNIESIDISEDE